MQNQPTCELNGIKYLLFEYPFTGGSSKVKSFEKKVREEYKGIIQGIGEVNKGFWGINYIIINVLIPENRVMDFNADSSI